MFDYRDDTSDLRDGGHAVWQLRSFWQTEQFGILRHHRSPWRAHGESSAGERAGISGLASKRELTHRIGSHDDPT